MKKIPRSKPFAKKSLGQNFLVDAPVVNRIVSILDLSPEDLVIEIGPGRGALTGQILKTGAHLTAIELDRDLISLLESQFSSSKNFSVIEADILDVDFSNLLRSNIKDQRSAKIVANLPYYISTAILKKLADQREHFSKLILMFQREVVERIAAKPGSSARGYLTVLVESAFEVEKLFDVSPTAFRPAPKVWSSVVRLTPKSLEINEYDSFLVLVSSAFGQKRKTILNNLKTKYSNVANALESSGISGDRRAETLTLAEWITLNNALKEN